MKIREVPEIPTPPNLKAYEEKFGHRQSPEASRAHPRAVLDQMAKEALEKGEPIPQWRDRHKTRLGNVNDQRYKNLREDVDNEELTQDSPSALKRLQNYCFEKFIQVWVDTSVWLVIFSPLLYFMGAFDFLDEIRSPLKGLLVLIIPASLFIGARKIITSEMPIRLCILIFYLVLLFLFGGSGGGNSRDQFMYY